MILPSCQQVALHSHSDSICLTESKYSSFSMQPETALPSYHHLPVLLGQFQGKSNQSLIIVTPLRRLVREGQQIFFTWCSTARCACSSVTTPFLPPFLFFQLSWQLSGQAEETSVLSAGNDGRETGRAG